MSWYVTSFIFTFNVTNRVLTGLSFNLQLVLATSWGCMTRRETMIASLNQLQLMNLTGKDDSD